MAKKSLAKKILPRLLIVALIVGGAGVYYYKTTQDTDEILYYGEAEAVSYDIYSKAAGIIDEMTVEEGDWVEVEQAVGHIESEAVAYQVEKASVAMDIAKTNERKSTSAARDEERAIQENSIEQLKQQKSMTESSLASARKLYEQSELATASLLAVYELQQRNYEDMTVLVEEGIEPSASLDTLETAVVTSEIAYTTSQLDTSKVANEIQGLKAQITAYEYQISSAQEALTLMDSGYSEEDRTLTELNTSLAEVDGAIAEVALENLSINAYQDGIVESINYEVGDYVGLGSPVLTLYDPTELTLDLYVSESDLLKLEVGKALEFAVVASPDIIINGVVKKIASESMFTPVNIVTASDRERLVFPVTVIIKDAGAIKPGMLLVTDLTGVEE